MSVWELHPSLSDRAETLDLVADLLGGTTAMRGGPTMGVSGNVSTESRWLTRFASDSADSYRARLQRAYLFGAFSSAVEDVTAKVFAEEIAVDGVPEDLLPIVDDADRCGTSLHRYAARHFSRKTAFGAVGILVMMASRDSLPASALTPEGLVSEAGRRTFGVRPFFVPAHRRNIINWEFGPGAFGNYELLRVVIREDSRVAKTADGPVTIERLRELVIVDGQCVANVYERRSGATDKAQVAAGETPIETVPLGIPVVPLVIDFVAQADDEDDPLCVDVALAELAWLNLQHFQETAEQGIALHNLRQEGLVEMGVSDEETKKPIIWNAMRSRRVTAPPGGYSLEFVGPSGRGVTAGESSLEKIEQRMARLGAQPLTRGSGNATATAAAIDESKSDSAASMWARGTEDAFERAFRIADMLMRSSEQVPLDQRLPECSVSLAGISTLSPEAHAARFDRLIAMFDRGIAKARQVIECAIAARILPADTDVDEMDEAAQAAAIEKIRAQQELFAAAGSAERTEPDPDQPDDRPEPTPPAAGQRMMREAARS